jgi:uncharacterized protein YgiM (DUF1202 family)
MMHRRLSRFVCIPVAMFVFAAAAFGATWNSSVSPARAQEATPEPTATQEATTQVATAQEATPEAATTQETTEFQVDQAVVVTTTDGDSLNFREDASTSANVIAALPEGTYGIVVDGPVEGTDEDSDVSWYEIEVDGVAGFVTGEFLADAATEGTFEADTTVYVNTDTLNLRAEANIDSDVVTQLTTNTEATVLGGPVEADDYSWYELDVDGTIGWAARNFLALAPSEGAPLADATTDGATLSVNTDTLNVRDAAGLSGNVLETIAFGDTVTDLGVTETVDGFDWSQVETSSGTTGWVASIYLTSDPADLLLTVDAVATVNADGVNLRDAASLSGSSIGTLATGDMATILSASEAADGYLWYQVETAIGTGWVAGEFLDA